MSFNHKKYIPITEITDKYYMAEPDVGLVNLYVSKLDDELISELSKIENYDIDYYIELLDEPNWDEVQDLKLTYQVDVPYKLIEHVVELLYKYGYTLLYPWWIYDNSCKYILYPLED